MFESSLSAHFLELGIQKVDAIVVYISSNKPLVSFRIHATHPAVADLVSFPFTIPLDRLRESSPFADHLQLNCIVRFNLVGTDYHIERARDAAAQTEKILQEGSAIGESKMYPLSYVGVNPQPPTRQDNISITDKRTKLQMALIMVEKGTQLQQIEAWHYLKTGETIKTPPPQVEGKFRYDLLATQTLHDFMKYLQDIMTSLGEKHRVHDAVVFDPDRYEISFHWDVHKGNYYILLNDLQGATDDVHAVP